MMLSATLYKALRLFEDGVYIGTVASTTASRKCFDAPLPRHLRPGWWPDQALHWRHNRDRIGKLGCAIPTRCDPTPFSALAAL